MSKLNSRCAADEPSAPAGATIEHEMAVSGHLVRDVLGASASHPRRSIVLDGDGGHEGSCRKRGRPNDPVGINWSDLNLEHYGLHGETSWRRATTRTSSGTCLVSPRDGG